MNILKSTFKQLDMTAAGTSQRIIMNANILDGINEMTANITSNITNNVSRIAWCMSAGLHVIKKQDIEQNNFTPTSDHDASKIDRDKVEQTQKDIQDAIFALQTLQNALKHSTDTCVDCLERVENKQERK